MTTDRAAELKKNPEGIKISEESELLEQAIDTVVDIKT
jgi:hypothetical protein